MRGLSYQRLQAYCERNGLKVGAWLEHVIDHHMSQDGGEPVHTVIKPKLGQHPTPKPVAKERPEREWQEGDGDPLSGVTTW